MPVRVPAAERALDVLTVLARASGPMTASGVARTVGMPRSSTYQLLAVLADRGFVRHLPDDERWALGLAAFEVGSAYLRNEPMERLAQPLLRQLADQADLPVVAHLGVLRGAETYYLLKEGESSRVTVITEVGVRLPAPLTASGRAILMTLPRAQVRAQCAVPGAFVDRTGRGPQSLSALRDLLAREQRRGYAEEDGFITDGYASVAVPVLHADGQAAAAIGLTFRGADVPPERRPRLARAARRCADDLRGRLNPL